MSQVTVNRFGVASIQKRHPWVFRRSIETIQAKSGDTVSVFDEKKRFLGKAFFSGQSQISLRMLTFTEETINWDFFARRIDQAFQFRAMKVSGDNAYRLISSEADFFPGLIVDRYNDHLVVQTLCAATEKMKPQIVEFLKAQSNVTAIIERNDVNARELEGLEKVKGVLWGQLRDPVVITEGRLHYDVSVLEGQKTGAFLDQRENHLIAGKYAKGRVLDGFCYQGGFALQEARLAETVIAVDSSDRAIEAATKNAQSNQISNVQFHKAKVYDYLRDLKGKETFHMISLDPPAFAKSKRDVESATRAYVEVNAKALELIEKGGVLLTCSCSYHMTEALLMDALSQAARKTKRELRLLERRTQAIDHPILLSMPESFYLKCLIFEVW